MEPKENSERDSNETGCSADFTLKGSGHRDAAFYRRITDLETRIAQHHEEENAIAKEACSLFRFVYDLEKDEEIRKRIVDLCEFVTGPFSRTESVPIASVPDGLQVGWKYKGGRVLSIEKHERFWQITYRHRKGLRLS